MFRRPLAAGEVLHFHTPPIRPGPRRALLFAQVSAAASGPQVRRRTSSGRGGFDGAGTLFRRSRLTQEVLRLNAQFDGDVLRVQPGGPITTEDMATLTRTVDGYLTDHPKIDGVMMQTKTFPEFASMGSFADYARFIADHHKKVQRVALVTDFALAHEVARADAEWRPASPWPESSDIFGPTVEVGSIWGVAVGRPCPGGAG